VWRFRDRAELDRTRAQGHSHVHQPCQRTLTPMTSRERREGRVDGWASRLDGRVSRPTFRGAEKGAADDGSMRSSRSQARDRGATAVEFALLFPLLMLIVFGIVDFGRVLNAQITLTQAAREAARLDALGLPDVVARTQAAATGISPVSVTVTACPLGAAPSADAVVNVSYQFSFVTPIGAISALIGGSDGIGSPVTLNAQGVMPCET
jgi:TadE-like protein